MSKIIAYLVLLDVGVDSGSVCGNSESSCCDKHESCAYWASINECSKNSAWMLPNCPLSCHVCNPNSVANKQTLCGKSESSCCDKHESCAYWASINECNKNSVWMLPNCPLSCRVCTPDPIATTPVTQKSLCGTGDESNCCDKHESCAYWATNNECSKNPSWMLPNCPLSCRVCKTGSVVTKSPKQTSLRCSDNGMTNEQRQKFLDIHNNYRSLVAKGQAKDAYGGNAPRAARMKKMIYDCAIEESAMRNAKRCVFAHSPEYEIKNLGENIYYTSELKLDKSRAAEQACKGWFDELAKYGVGQENVLTDYLWNRPGTMIGHYTQMVWQDTYKLGCYVEWCSSMTYVVCQYGPQGNWFDKIIYEKGNPCTTDADCKCENCKCSREEALCIVQ